MHAEYKFLGADSSMEVTNNSFYKQNLPKKVWRMNAPHEEIQLVGFSYFEPYGIWTEGVAAEIIFPKDLIDFYQYASIEIIDLAFLDSSESFSIKLGLDSEGLTRYSFTQRPTANQPIKIEFNLDCDKRRNSIMIEIEKPQSPKDFGINDDSRMLGVAISKVVLKNELHGEPDQNYYDLLKFYEDQNRSSLSYKNFGREILSSNRVLADALGDRLNAQLRSINANELIISLSQILNLLNIPKSAAADFIDIAKTLLHFCELQDCKKEEAKSDVIVLNVGGFWSSGSSAVYDYLQGNSKIASLSKFGFEAVIVQQFYELLLNCNRENILNFFLKRILNVFTPFSEHERFMKSPKTNLMSLLHFENSTLSIEDYASFCKSFFQSLAQHGKSKVRALFTDFLFACAERGNGELNSSYLLLDQGPNSANLNCVSILQPGSYHVSVYRDPRDQYLSINKQITDELKCRDAFPASDFVVRFKKERYEFESLKDSLSREYKIISISFEDFVLKKSVRERLCLEVGLEPSFTSPYFDPNLSKQRIGKYRLLSDEYLIKQIALIENELGQFLWSPT